MATRPASTKPTRRPRQVNHHLLPPQLRMLVRIMGEQAAFRLVEHRGGTHMLVPARCSAEHWLMDLLGPVAFGALVAEMPNVRMDLPKYDSVLRQWRHQRVHELVRKGLTDAQVALQTNYSRRHIINIRQAEAEAAGDGNAAQFDLFAAVDAELEATAAEAGPTAHDPFGLARPGRNWLFGCWNATE